MGKRISLSKEARAGFRQLYQYLNRSFGQKRAQKWSRETLDYIHQLGIYPELGVLSHHPGHPHLRKLIFQQRTPIFYLNKPDTIHVVHIQDARAALPDYLQ